MINDLNKDNDKMDMINKVIKPINNKILYFFNSSNKVIDKNLININGIWGSGKSTIIHNLENNYEDKSNEIKWVIINCWEYETSLDPYLDLINDIANKIISFSELNEQQKQQEITKIRKLSVNLRIKYKYWELTPGIEYESSKKINKPKQLKEIIQELINELKIFVKKNKIVVIFDELDRCTPTNQIYFLSYIKNIFLKVTNIFYIISSNNEYINKNIMKECCNNDNKKEKYTEKIFSNTINLNNIFPIETGTFTENGYINDFRKKIKNITIITPRQMDNWLNQINEIIKNLENDKDFSLLKTNNNDDEWFKKNILWKIEFIIFYCYYIKNQDSEYYSSIINVNSNNIINSNFFMLVKTQLISKIDNQNVLYNEDLVSMILNNKNSYYPGLKFKLLWKDSINDPYYMYNPINFSASIPFLSPFLNEENIDKVFIREIDANANRTIVRGNRLDTMLLDSEDYLFKFDLKSKFLNLPKHSKLFFELIMIGHPASGNLMRFENIIKLDNICKIIENSIFDN